jgi:hypothetical protein
MNMKNRIPIVLGLAAAVLVGLIWLAARHDSIRQEPYSPATASDPEARLFALHADDTSGDDVRVTLHSLPTSGPVVTIISELDYDSARLKMKQCGINPQIGDGTQTAKVLHFAEPKPGVVRTVVAGTLAELPQAADVLACDFAVQPNAPAGPTIVRVHGQVADMTFEDRDFSAEKTIVISN